MSNFGWAYVDCATAGATVAGPTGSVQFLTGASATSGSTHLMFYTASTGEHLPHTLVLSGNLTVTGAISASALHYQDITHIDATGSTFFGDTYDDLHVRTGSLNVYSTRLPTGETAGSPYIVLSSSARSHQTFVRGFGGGYKNVTSSHYTASTDNYVLGIATPFTGGTAPVRVTIPTASLFGSGAILVVKDEVAVRGGSSIVLTRSITDTNTIDGDAYYTLTGTMPAISLYSNGTNWFVF